MPDSPTVSPVAARFALAGRRALVTGGSVSIGRAVALGLAEAGADLAIQASGEADAGFGRPDALEETRQAIAALGRRAVAITADFADADEAGRCVRDARDALGGLDILVACASIQYNTDFLSITPEQTARQIAVNFTATVALLQAAIPPMAAAGWGRVLSIGSVNAIRPRPELGVYAALKAAQHNLVLNLAAQYAGRGVTVNTLSPGLVATERNRWRRRDASSWAEVERRANPMGRAGRPEEMVGAALLLCSDAGAFITGADLPVTGGGHL